MLLTEATVRHVVLEKEHNEWVAKGVKFVHKGDEYVVKTTREIIICAGSVQSPQLLELSGIGNPDALKAAGIDVKVSNSAIGENLQEHMSKPFQTSSLFPFWFSISETYKDLSDHLGLRNQQLHRHTRRPTL